MFGSRMSYGTGCILKRESKRKNLLPLGPVSHFLSAFILGGLLVFFIKIKINRLISVERNLVYVESVSMLADNSITSQYKDFVSLNVRREPAVFFCFGHRV